MKPFLYLTALCALLLSHIALQAQEMDKELVDLAAKLSSEISKQGKKKVTVLDFTDLQGGSSELGKYIAEELTVNLVMVKQDFAILDRANLRKILAEHKLTAQGLVDPENAKKLGMFAGVDALVIGTIIPKDRDIQLTAKVITTDTAEIVSATKARFQADKGVEQMLAKPSEPVVEEDTDKTRRDKSKVLKTFGEVQVEFSLGIVNGEEYLLDLIFTNKNSRQSVWVALNRGLSSERTGLLTDPQGFEHDSKWGYITGIPATTFNRDAFYEATEVKPNESVSATLRFRSAYNKKPIAGPCRLQLEVLTGREIINGSGAAKKHHLITEIKAN